MRIVRNDHQCKRVLAVCTDVGTHNSALRWSQIWINPQMLAVADILCKIVSFMLLIRGLPSGNVDTPQFASPGVSPQEVELNEQVYEKLGHHPPAYFICISMKRRP